MFRTSRPIRYINQNLDKILGGIIAIAIILLIIHIYNNILKTNKEKMSNQIFTVEDIKKIETGYTDEEEIQTGNNQKNITLSNGEIEPIIKFINYCNNNDISNAYNLLSTSCKEILYSSKNEFYNNYYKKIFNNKKTYNITNIYSTDELKTYSLTILDDVLATGKYEEKNVHEELISIIKENNEEKLNINNFIKYEDINKVGSTDHLMLTINKRYIFAEYEIYSITAFNATDNYLKLDALGIENTSFLLDSKNKIYYLNKNKLKDIDLQIFPFTSRNLQVEFSKGYLEGNKIKTINFTSIDYKINTNEEKESISIELN